MLPSAPRNGDAVHARTPRPTASSAALTSRRTAACTTGSRTMPPRPEPGAAGFELRLHEQHEIRGGRGDGEQVRCDSAQRDERDVDDAHIRGGIERAGAEITNVRALHHRDPLVLPERPRELAAADVDGGDVSRAAAQQTIGEPARRRADVDRDPPVDIETERVEPARELLAAARDVRVVVGRENHDGLFGRDLARGSGDGRASDEHATGIDRFRGAGPARHEPPPHELNVETPPQV